MSHEIKRIALCIGSLQRGGAERVMVNLAERFATEGVAVTLISTFRVQDEYPLPQGVTRVISGLTPEEEAFSGGPALAARTIGRPVNTLRRIRKLRRLIREAAPELVLSFIGKTNVMSLLAAGPLHIPVAVSVRADPSMEYPTRFSGWLANLLFPKAAAVILQTEEAKEAFSPAVRKRVVILPNALRPAFLARKVCAESERVPLIVSVGRLDANKNHALLLRAFAAAGSRCTDQETSPLRNYRILICGEGEERAKLEALARELGIADRVELPGNVPDVAERIGRARIFVLCSYQEGMPNALLEAMSLGLACISTDCPCGGPRTLIRERENGLLIPMPPEESRIHMPQPRMEEVLAGALFELAADDGLRRRLSEEALSVRDTYAPDAVFAAWKKVLTDAVHTGGGNTGYG
ncbi:MAG: glycosyltransferase [Butyrivibrio sp.]|nr:glycosyltransferase [Butyrivibrio sp.]